MFGNNINIRSVDRLIRCVLMVLLSLFISGCSKSDVPTDKNELIDYMSEADMTEYSVELNTEIDVLTEIVDSTTSDEIIFRDNSIYTVIADKAVVEKDIFKSSFFNGETTDNESSYFDFKNSAEYQKNNDTDKQYIEIVNYDLVNLSDFLKDIETSNSDIFKQLKFNDDDKDFYILEGTLESSSAKQLWRNLVVDGMCSWDVFFNENIADIPVSIYVDKDTYLIDSVDFDLEDMLNAYFENHQYYDNTHVYEIRSNDCKIQFVYDDLATNSIEIPDIVYNDSRSFQYFEASLFFIKNEVNL